MPHVTVSAKNGRRTAVMAWLDAGGNINQWWEDQPDADSVGRTPERDDRTLLMIASSFGHDKLVDSLLKRGALVDLQDREGRTALMYATRGQHSAVIRRLLSADADVGMCDVNGWKARDQIQDVHLADGVSCMRAFVEHAAAMVQLADAAASILSASGAATSAARGDLPSVVAWLDSGGSADAAWEEDDGYIRGATMLMHASAYGHEDLVDLLLNRGASLDLQVSDGGCALMYASARNYAGIVLRLLRAGAEKGLRNIHGRTARELAEIEGHSECVRVFKHHLKKLAADRRQQPHDGDMSTEQKARLCQVCRTEKSKGKVIRFRKVEAKGGCCGRCNQIWYCDRRCQKADWPWHKQECSVLCDLD